MSGRPGRHPDSCGGPGVCPLCDATVLAREDAGDLSEAEWDRYEAGPGWNTYPGQPGTDGP